MRTLPGFAVGVVAPALLVAGCATTGPQETAPPPSSAELQQLREDFAIPDCPVTAPDAEPVDRGLPRTQLPCLGSDVTVNLAGLERRPTVVNFWAQWCGPCREEAPFLRDVSQAAEEVAFVGVNFDDPEPAWALEFAGLAEWRYPHVADPEGTLRSQLGVPGLPMTLFVDETGAIVEHHFGVIESEEELEAAIAEHFGIS
ncbi:TlpA family protein disulfide reductase [Tessaracoccus rhinocerotis]|uniref:TlpA family protein disulfide reductase n=1 Tax=Tessaracoccus rhinocerotis TaxID=1689449 RepID=UPI00163D9091|nr:TlpA disulfide reductase family protein [Tessaracoccus rhinocerotis]